jgi:molybdenum cofactor synthesis domain-containing protein
MMDRVTAVLTVSDSASRGERQDLSGPAVAELLRRHGFEVIRQEIVSDDQPGVESALIRLCEMVPLVVTTGGTGISARDITPEATRAVSSRFIEGIPEKMRADGLAKTPFAVLSRAVCGIRGGSLILNLPGSPGGAQESLLSVINLLPHVLDLLAGKTGHRELAGDV